MRSVLNRRRIGHGLCNSIYYEWNLVGSLSCECGEIKDSGSFDNNNIEIPRLDVDTKLGL